MSQPLRVVVCANDPRRFLELPVVASGELRIELCRTEGEILRALTEGPVAAVLWELGARATHGLPHAAAALRAAAPSLPLIVEMQLSRTAARQLLTIAALEPAPRVVIRGVDRLEVVVEEVLEHGSEPGAHGEIACTLLPLVPSGAIDIVATAAVVGHRRSSVARFARICGLSSRTVEWRLQVARLPVPVKLLGWMLSLHGLWRLDVLGWTAKRVAAAAGFETANVWSNYVERHTGSRPSAHLRDDGFASLLRRCCDVLCETHTTG